MQRTWQESHLQEQTNTLKQQPQWHYYCEKEIVLDEDCHLYTTAAPTNNKKPSQKHLKKGRRNFPRGSTPRCKMRKKWFIWKATATRPPLWGPTRVKKSVLSQCNTPDRKGNCNNKQPLWNTNFTATAAETFLDNNWHIYIYFFFATIEVPTSQRLELLDRSWAAVPTTFAHGALRKPPATVQMNTASISGCHALTATATLEAQKMHGSAKIKHWLFAIASISENLRQSFFFVCGHALLYANFLQQLKTRKNSGYHALATTATLEAAKMHGSSADRPLHCRGMTAHEEKALSQIFRNRHDRKQPMLLILFIYRQDLLGFRQTWHSNARM